MDQTHKLAKIKWACRRGMLELDYILNEFLGDGFKTLSAKQQDDFLQFLDNEDPDLYSWLMGFRKAEIEDDIIMVNIIRAAKK